MRVRVGKIRVRSYLFPLGIPLTLTIMGRQFFVGGNFKMNPATRDQKRVLIDVLKKAEIDSKTGLTSSPADDNHIVMAKESNKRRQSAPTNLAGKSKSKPTPRARRE